MIRVVVDSLSQEAVFPTPGGNWVAQISVSVYDDTAVAPRIGGIAIEAPFTWAASKVQIKTGLITEIINQSLIQFGVAVLTTDIIWPDFGTGAN